MAIEKIEKEKEYNIPVNVQIIPKLKEFNEVTLSPGDTLVAFVDHEYGI